MKTILFNADDWGLSAQIHQAITSLHRHEAIDAAGIMMGQPFTPLAVEYAGKNPGLLVGLHLFATDRDCKPMARPSWPVLWPEDIFLNTAIGLPFVDQLVLEEVEAQLMAYKETGLPLHFLNSHFHFHAHHRIADQIIGKLLNHFPDFKGWIRYGDARTMPDTFVDAVSIIADLFESGTFRKTCGQRHNDTLWGIDQVFSNRAGNVIDACGKLGPGFHEFFFHPGRASKLTENGTDHDALMELSKLLPASMRGLDRLPNP